MRLDHQINLVRAAQIGMPLAVVFGIGGLVTGLCTTAIIAGFFLWEYQIKPSLPPLYRVNRDTNEVEQVPEALNPKGPTFF